eukprot:432745-Pyramimonas_sp.AAC.1
MCGNELHSMTNAIIASVHPNAVRAFPAFQHLHSALLELRPIIKYNSRQADLDRDWRAILLLLDLLL